MLDMRMEWKNIKPWYIRIPSMLFCLILVGIPMFLICSVVVGIIMMLSTFGEMLGDLLNIIKDNWRYDPFTTKELENMLDV